MLDVDLVIIHIAAIGVTAEALRTDGSLDGSGEGLYVLGLPGYVDADAVGSESSSVLRAVGHGATCNHPAEHVGPLLGCTVDVTDTDTACRIGKDHAYRCEDIGHLRGTYGVVLEVVDLAVIIMIDGITYFGIEDFNINTVILHGGSYLAGNTAVGRSGLAVVVLTVTVDIQILFHMLKLY